MFFDVSVKKYKNFISPANNQIYAFHENSYFPPLSVYKKINDERIFWCVILFRNTKFMI